MIVVAADEIDVVVVRVEVKRIVVVMSSSLLLDAGRLEVAGGEDGGELAGEAGLDVVDDEDAGGLASNAGPVEFETCA